MTVKDGIVTRSIAEDTLSKQITILKGMFTGDAAKYPLSLDALALAIESHGDQCREGGELYISHPITMACTAKGLGLREDVLFATILLHDVCEDCGLQIQNISESSQVRNAVRYMTIAHHGYDFTKADVKRRYFEELLQCREALICKALDRINNLESMVGVFDRERALKNWRETYHLLMPVLKKAKEGPMIKDCDLIHTLRERLRGNLKWAMYYYQFTEDEMYATYGTMSFEQKTLTKRAGDQSPGELPEYCEVRFPRPSYLDKSE